MTFTWMVSVGVGVFTLLLASPAGAQTAGPAAGCPANWSQLQPSDPAAVPPEASQILRAGRIAGRVTSSRMSPALGRSVCLAQVDADLAEPGTLLTIRLPSGADTEATSASLFRRWSRFVCV